MARNYEKMAKVWQGTTRANPYDDESVVVGDYNFRMWFGETDYARDFLEYHYDGLNVSKCVPAVVGFLFERVIGYDAETMIREWMVYSGIDENELKRAYNLAFWNTHRACDYTLGEQ